ncbi:MAG: Primosomal protein N' [Alphaproteobacteria bacterium MarineAlpha5_Bin11]|nr:primosomal protein N' [Pelagibacteraceae bacterium]PPR45016.1 MAG: Primosomal protein N' [Alphaproteobacteria bacterium MarineAlpha5_Bin11]PPR51422.1 MAG: Primosomal protein N' [Alphaproteobacteria bacterium MarineAlpha5_Bin10]|tara:strand:+ start:18855 stop:20831 length:1977 start_codon:yes stop_codon:yes gene_type:complete
MYCKIIVPVPVNKEFIYRCKKDMSIKKGDIVLVPFGHKSEELGLVSSIIKENQIDPSIKNIKYIKSSVHNLNFNSNIFEFIKWVSDYTLNSRGSILKMVLPNKNIVNYDFKSEKEDSENSNLQLAKLNNEQKLAFNLINKNINNSQQTIVLEGVTGSGKTEVYFQVIDLILKNNLQSLIMLPEISLTPQIEKRFLERFGFVPDIWHSKISAKKKKEIWHRCFNGISKIIIGARSSLFLPFKKLGLIVVDEEHDVSYKQEDGARYHARDMAIVKSVIEKIPIILSTATPSIETFYNVKTGRYKHVFLPKQYSGADLPKIDLINLKKENLPTNSWISKIIIENISNCLKNDEQSLIFLNRRGYAPLTICSSCGSRIQCNNCSSWLVMHNQRKILLCHHCGHTKSLTENCKKCNSSKDLKYVGPGIERVAEELHNYFPSAKIEIISSDNMNTENKIKKLINRMESREIDILVGTQIVAKSYHFPSLSFVGIIDADAGLVGGDLRAPENTYNLMQQVSGRAGRSTKIGKVCIQTYFNQNPLIKSLQNRSREFFLEQTLLERRKFNLPPYGCLLAIIVSGKSKLALQVFIKEMTKCYPKTENVLPLGPVEAPLFLLRGKYRYRFLIKGKKRSELNRFAKNWLQKLPVPGSIRLIIDVDPFSFI